MKVMEGSSEKPIKKRDGYGGLPAKSQAGQECTKNNWLHVKGNFKSAKVAVFRLFSTSLSRSERLGRSLLNTFKTGAINVWGTAIV
jgi:hypothetical protein